jgi:diguanylate cyclase (GGDEF)-like protein
MTSESERNAFERMSDRDRASQESDNFHDAFEGHDASADHEPHRPKKITFDDFQITRAEQEAQVEEERRAWKERQDRIDGQKGSIFKFAVPRIKSLKDEMIGAQNKLPFFKKQHREDIATGPIETPPPTPNSNEPYFAEHEKSVIRVTRRVNEHRQEEAPAPTVMPARYERSVIEEDIIEEELPEEELLEEATEQDVELVESESVETWQEEPEPVVEEMVEMEETDYFDDDEDEEVNIVLATPAQVISAPVAYEEDPAVDEIPLEPQIEPSMKSFLDALRSFDSYPRRAFESRDPRADFVVLLGEVLDILRDELDATSAMFFWVNSKRQQLVLESAALDDRAYQFLAGDKRFSIELDAVSRVVSRRKPELHSNIPPQAELDLIPYYRDAIGIASFAGMPVFFGDGLVAVLTVDSVQEEHFSPETLRILTNHSRLISGLIRSYIEKYDLLASARTLDAARKLHQIVSPDASLRREQRKSPDYVLRTLTEAASDIIDWDWLATTSFDESRRLWTLSNLQSKHGGGYVPPMTPISMEESLVGKCLTTGKSILIDTLSTQNIRYNIEEDRQSGIGHSFLAIPIRTSNKNYGTLAIEHTEKARFSDADVETLEHLARSAASALEIIALGEIVGERALTDLLTGIYNKRGLIMRATEELQRAMQFDEPLTFVMFEIDGSQEFASRFAQEDSDTVVLAIARLLKFGARNFDVIARTGDFTFAALLVKMTDEEAYLWSEKMRKMIVSEVIAIGKRSFSVTASIGVSGARRDGSVDDLIQGAELALERAEELGGNNVIVY